MRRTVRERLLEFFTDKKTIIWVGLICLFYFYAQSVPDAKLIAKILPPLPHWYYYTLSGCVILYQIIVWIRFKLLDMAAIRDVLSWILFAAEFGLILFVVSLLSWPMYWVFRFFGYVTRV